MRPVKQIDFINHCFFVVYKNFNVVIPQQIQINFMAVVANSRNESGVLVKFLHLLIQGIFSQLCPANHGSKIRKHELWNSQTRGKVA